MSLQDVLIPTTVPTRKEYKVKNWPDKLRRAIVALIVLAGVGLGFTYSGHMAKSRLAASRYTWPETTAEVIRLGPVQGRSTESAYQEVGFRFPGPDGQEHEYTLLKKWGLRRGDEVKGWVNRGNHSLFLETIYNVNPHPSNFGIYILGLVGGAMLGGFGIAAVEGIQWLLLRALKRRRPEPA